MADKPKGRSRRAPGELGGHTLSPDEQEPAPSLGEPQNPSSMDVPMPEAGAKEAVPGAGMETVARRRGGAAAMKPTGKGNEPTSRTQRTQADSASAEAARDVERRSGVAASRPPPKERKR